MGGLQRCLTYSEIASEIHRISDRANGWVSTIIIPHGISKLDISSAAMGASSYTPIGATKQPHEYPRWGSSSSVYRLDPDLFNENSWPDLQRMLIKVGCVSGFRVVLRQCRTGKSTFWKKTYELRCSHGIIMTNNWSLLFVDDNLGPINVPKERLKRVKSIGAARGNYHLLC